MPARTPFKKSIATIQPEPIPAPTVSFSSLPTTAGILPPADNMPDEPSLIPDGYASASRGAVFVDVNTNRITSPGQTTGIQLEKDSSTYLDVKTSPRRCELLSASTPFLDIPERELNELVESRKLENGLDELDLELIGVTVPSVTGSLNDARSKVSKIMQGLTDLVIHSEKPLVSLNIVGSSKEIISSIQESVIELNLPCGQPNYDIPDLCGIEDNAEVQTSTRIFSMALAATANDGDPGSEFVIKSVSSAVSKLSGKTIKFVTSQKSASIGKKQISKSAENPTSARDQNSIKKTSTKITKPQVGRILVKSSATDDVRYQVPITAISDRWDDLDEVIKYSERVIAKFNSYYQFDLARQGKPIKNEIVETKSATASATGPASLSNSSKPGSVPAQREVAKAVDQNLAAVTRKAGGFKPAAVGKEGKSAPRASTISGMKPASSKAGSQALSSPTKANKFSKLKTNSPQLATKKSSKSVTLAISNSTENSATRSSIIISRLCASISNILRREMMLSRATNAGLSSSGKNDKVTTFVRSLIKPKSSVTRISLLNIGNSCSGGIITTHIDSKKSIQLLEPRLFSDKKKTFTGAYENLILPAVKFPGNISPLTTYVDNLKTNVVNPIDQFLNLMLVDIANDITPTVILRAAMSEVGAALSSLEEIIGQDGGGVANDQIIELICMNLYADPKFKRRSKRIIYEKFLNPEQQFSFDGSSSSVNSSISNPDSKTKIKMRSTSSGKTTETISEIETKDQTDEDDDSSSSPGDFVTDLLAIRKNLPGKKYDGYNEESAAARAGSLTFQTRTSEMLDSFGKPGDSATLSKAVTNIVDSLLETCKSAIGTSVLSNDETELKESGLSLSALNFMVFDLVSEICRAFFFLYIFKDTGATNYEGTSGEDPSFTISLKSERKEKGECLTPVESYENDISDVVSSSIGALLGVKEISSGPKMLKSVAKEIQDYENDIRDHYARVFALNEIFDTVYQSFDEFRTLLSSGNIAYARQQLSSRRETQKTIEYLNQKVLADSRWRFDKRLRSIFDRTQVSSQNEIDCIQHFFRTRNSIVTNDVIGNSQNSLLCAVGIPFGMSSTGRDELITRRELVEISLAKRDIEFQGLLFEQQKFMFDPSLKVIVRPQSLSDTFQTLIERRTQYYFFMNGMWSSLKYQDAVKRIVTIMGLKEQESIQILRNHVIDFMAKSFLRHVSMMEYSCDELFRAQKNVSSPAVSSIIEISRRIPIAPQGLSIANFLEPSPGGYSVTVGAHAIDGANEADCRLLYRLMQDPAFSGDFLINEVFSTTPYEDIYCIVIDPDTFEVRTDAGVPTASYSSILESLGEVTSLKDPGDGIVISTKTGKFLRQRDQLRRFSGSEIAVTCTFIPPRKISKKIVTSKLTTKVNKFGFKSQERRS